MLYMAKTSRFPHLSSLSVPLCNIHWVVLILEIKRSWAESQFQKKNPETEMISKLSLNYGTYQIYFLQRVSDGWILRKAFRRGDKLSCLAEVWSMKAV